MERAARTDLQSERAAQARWRLRPRHAGMADFDRLVDNEFLDPEAHRAREAAALRRLIEFVAAEVPYYRDLLAQCRLGPDDLTGPADLTRLPLLDKLTARRNEARLRPTALPRGEHPYGLFKSSGTTGQPISVRHTRRSNRMFGIVAQRGYRWFRFDPLGALAFIRLANQLPRLQKRRDNPDGETVRLDRWRYVGAFFETGPWLGFNVTNPVDAQIEWLGRERPRYLATYSETLEHLCLATGGVTPAGSIEATMAISEQLTGSMRRRIERTFAAPVFQNYGLNEIGLVAARCAAGRYHVHTEHCLVEIVDERGQPVAPGRRGRIAVTALNNLAMPLIRYDTDDLAEAVAGPCPCGRTLPAFGDILGRYSRIAYLPDGTLGVAGAVRAALEAMPADLARPLRRFQLHQRRDNRFVLRLAAAAPMPAEFARRIHAAWHDAAAEFGWPLEIVAVAEIPSGPGGKFQDFTSEHMPDPDDAEDRGR